MESILKTVKKMLGLSAEDTSFDIDIIIHINSVLATLNQIGVGVKNFTITSEGETWNDFLEDNRDLEQVKSYVYLKTRIAFDPPTGSALDSFKELAKELEWRLYTVQENKKG